MPRAVPVTPGVSDGRFEVASLSLPPDSLFFWLITVSTILSAIVANPGLLNRPIVE